MKKKNQLVYTIYDIIARVGAENMQELKDVFGSKIRGIENICSSFT
jgi:hypothetical protein